jgi:23S rRNA G2445 N2-methylase RlmL
LPEARIVAADLDADRLRNARANAARAGTAERIQFVRADAGSEDWGTGRFDALITNPPWNRAVGAAGALTDTLDPFWQHVPSSLTSRGRICTIAEADLDVPARLRRMGYSVALAQAVRLAGRVSHVVLAAPPGADEVRLPDALDLWHERAIKAGIVSAHGF